MHHLTSPQQLSTPWLSGSRLRMLAWAGRAIRFAYPMVIACATLTVAGASVRCQADEGEEFFEKKIRPVLVKHCYQCHSVEGEKVQGGLLVDSREGMRTGGDSGPAIVPNNVEESLLIDAIRYGNFEMPPKQKLPQETVNDFVKWVEMGAPDPREKSVPLPTKREIDIAEARKFWAFQPLHRPEIPAAEPGGWSTNPIDRLIDSKRQAAGLTPMPDADRYTLLRRLSLDLTGLPPTPAEIAAFVADDSPGGIEATVDRLLASPHFGEHWGRHWLDLARYADSNGGDINLTHREAWRYRDYVVNALNDDKPFNQFVHEQIAGDLLPSTSDEQRAERLIATGFLVIGPKMLSERDKEKLHMDVVDEQLDTIGRTFLGLTVGCARCHDHKFDPIPTADYYAMGGILRSTTTVFGIRMGNVNVSGWNERPLPIAPEHAAALEEHQQAVKKLEDELRKTKSQLDKLSKGSGKTENQPDVAIGDLAGIVLDDVDARKIGFWKESKLSPRYVAAGYIHDDKQDKGMKSLVYTPDIPVSGEYEVRMSYTANGGRDKKVPVTVTHAKGATELFINQEQQPELEGLFHSLGRYSFDAGKTGSVTIATTGTTGHVIADAVQFVSVEELKQQPGRIVKQRSPQDPVTPEADTVKEQEQLAKVIKSLEADLKQLKGVAPAPAPMAMAAGDREQPADCTICIRGEPHNRGPMSPRGFLQVVETGEPFSIPPRESGRRELAQWIASDLNPLTPRVTVNRVWQHLMGAGLVSTVDNFGELGDRPSHPELLDELAIEFVESGWSIKQVVRRIVLTRTYQLSSQHSEGAYTVDPENRLHWRRNRRPITAESIRDSILLASNSLDRTAGGSSVAHLGESAVGNNPGEAKEGAGPVPSARRSLYLPIIRNDLPDELTLFNFADPDVCTGERAQTTVPLQALFMMNSRFVRQHSRKLAEELLSTKPADTNSCLTELFLRTLNRPPREDERERAEQFLSWRTGTGSDQEEGPEARLDRWSGLVHALLATAEFRLVD